MSPVIGIQDSEARRFPSTFDGILSKQQEGTDATSAGAAASALASAVDIPGKSPVPDDWGFAIEAPKAHPIFPFYLDPAIQAQYKRFSELQMIKDGYGPSLFITWVWVLASIGKYTSGFIIGFKMTSWLLSALVITAAICFGLSVVYLLTFPLSSFFPSITPVQLLRFRNVLLRASYIFFNISNCFDLFNRNFDYRCDAPSSSHETLLCSQSNNLPTSLLMTLCCVFFYSFVMHTRLNYCVTTLVWIMDAVSILVCCYLVREGRIGWQLISGVFVSCVIIFISSHWMFHQHMRAFEYYLAYKKSLQTELGNATEMARHEREHLRMVLANVAHDLKTPLQAFDAGIHAIRSTISDVDKPSRSKQLYATLEELNASCAFMAMQINRALDVSKIESRFKLMPKYESANIDSMVRWAASIMSCIQSKIVIETEFINWPSKLRTIVTDKVWFQENLLCLLSNAVKYSSEEGRVRMALSLFDETVDSQTSEGQDAHAIPINAIEMQCLLGDGPIRLDFDEEQPRSMASHVVAKTRKMAKVEVQDFGIGVPEDRRYCLFKPFSQTQRRAGGTGLGLYSLALRVRELSGSYGMRPNVDAVSGKEVDGSVFYFTIPCVASASKTTSLDDVSSESNNIIFVDRSDERVCDDYCLSQSSPDASEDSVTNDDSNVKLGGGKVLEKGDQFCKESIFKQRTCSEEVSAAASCAVSTKNNNPSLLRGVNERQTNAMHGSPNSVASSSVINERNIARSDKPLILVVDDAPTTIKVMERALVQMGADVHTATNGFVALKMMKSQLYTLVIMDIQMPVMDGFESVRQLRAWERGPGGDGRHQYIIGASASPDEGTRRDALDVHMDEFGVKPLNVSTIMQKMRDLLK